MNYTYNNHKYDQGTVIAIESDGDNVIRMSDGIIMLSAENEERILESDERNYVYYPWEIDLRRAEAIANRIMEEGIDLSTCEKWAGNEVEEVALLVEILGKKEEFANTLATAFDTVA